MKAWSWSDLGRSWGGLGRSWGDLGWSWGGLWRVLGALGAVLGGPGAILMGLEAVFGGLGWSWGGLGAPWEAPGRLLGGSWGALRRSKIDQKIVPKLDPKTVQIATEKNGPNTTPVDVSELEQGQRDLDPITQKSYQNRYRYD